MPLWLEMFPARRVFDQNDVGVLLQQVPHSPAGGSLMFPPVFNNNYTRLLDSLVPTDMSC